MAQRSAAPLRVAVPSRYPAATLITPSPLTSRFKFPFSPALTPTPNPRPRPNETPAWIIGLLQLIPLYMLNRWMNVSAASVSLAPFIFLSLASSAVGLWCVQQPGKGRPLTSQQWGLVLAHGGVFALSALLKFEGMRYCGPMTSILGEYAGAVLGKWLLNSFIKGDRGSGVRGLMAMMIGVFLLSQGWALDPCFPLSIKHQSRLGFLASRIRNFMPELKESDPLWIEEKNCVRMWHIVAPILAGLLLSLYKASAAQTSLKSMPKKRLQTLSVTSAAFLSFPLAVLQWDSQVMLDSSTLWPLCGMVGLGMLQVLYGDSYYEEKLIIKPLSLNHYLITLCCICLLELWYGLEISLIGFIFCGFLLGVGIRELTFSSGGLSWESIADQESAHMFSTLVKNPFRQLLNDRKSRKIALFLLINAAFMVVEFIFGFLSNSLGLISDACHMLFDCAALAIGLYASYISKLPANEKLNYGYGRFEVLSGYANAIFLILVASLIVLESLERILDPPEISTESLLIVSVGGLLVNMIGLIFFHDEHHHAHWNDTCSHSNREDPTLKCDHSHDEHMHGHGNECKSGHSHLHNHKHDTGHSHDHLHGHDFCNHNGNKYKIQMHSKEPEAGQTPHKEDQHDHFEGFKLHVHSHDHDHDRKPDHLDNGDISPTKKFHREAVHANGNARFGSTANEENVHKSQPEHGALPKDHVLTSHYHDSPLNHSPERHGAYHSDAYFLSNKDHTPCGFNDQGQAQQLQYSIAGDHVQCQHMHFAHSIDAKAETETEDYLVNSSQEGKSASEKRPKYAIHHHDNHDDDYKHQHKSSHHHHVQHHHDHDNDSKHHDENSNHQHLHHHHIDHNMQGIFLHVLADTLGSVGVVISTILIRYKGWLWTDPACSIFISLLIISSVIPLVRNSAEILLQRSPRSYEDTLKILLMKLDNIQGLSGFHRLHLWSLTNKEVVGTLQVHTASGIDKVVLRKEVLHLFEDANIMDMTVQVEDTRDFYCMNT